MASHTHRCMLHWVFHSVGIAECQVLYMGIAHASTQLESSSIRAFQRCRGTCTTHAYAHVYTHVHTHVYTHAAVTAHTRQDVVPQLCVRACICTCVHVHTVVGRAMPSRDDVRGERRGCSERGVVPRGVVRFLGLLAWVSNPTYRTTYIVRAYIFMAYIVMA